MTPSPDDPGSWSLQTADDVDQALAAVWAAARDLVRERMKVLRAQVSRLVADLPLTGQEQAEAGAAAHKLAGTLGTFGLPRGSQLASSIEVALEESPVPDAVLADLATWLQELGDLVDEALSGSGTTTGAAPGTAPAGLPTAGATGFPPGAAAAPGTATTTSTGQVAGYVSGTAVAALSASESCSVPGPTAVPVDAGGAQVLLVARDQDEAAPLMAEAASRGIEVFHVPFDTRRIAASGTLPDTVDVIVVQFGQDLPAALATVRYLSLPGRQILVVGAPPGLVERRELLAAGADRVMEGRPDPARTMQTVLTWRKGDRGPGSVMILGENPALAQLASEFAAAGMSASPVTETSQLTADSATDGSPALLVDQDSSPLDAVDLCRLLRRRREWDPCPIVVMLSEQDAFLSKRLLSAGADDVVATSLPPAKIANVLRLRGRDCQGAVQPSSMDTAAGLLLPDAFISLASTRLERCHDLQVPLAVLRVVPDGVDEARAQVPGAAGDAVPEGTMAAAADALRSCFRAHDLFGHCVKGGIHAVIAGMSEDDLQLRLPVVRKALEDRHVRAGVSSVVSFADDQDLHELLAVTHGQITPRVGTDSEDLPAVGGELPGPPGLSSYRPIAVVDDDPVIRELLRRVLISRGYTVVEFDNGVDAAKALSDPTAPERFRLVVLDVNLPGTNGFGVLRAMRERGTLARLPVILLTARSRSEDVLEGLELGASDHVAKPFAVAVLLHKITSLTGQWAR